MIYWFVFGVVSDLFLGGNDDAEPGGGDDLRAEYLCPFCAEDYDVVSLCCHIDEEHPLQANTGVGFHKNSFFIYFFVFFLYLSMIKIVFLRFDTFLWDKIM